MPRHRAPSPGPLSTLAAGAAGVTLGVSALSSTLVPATALAATGHSDHVGDTHQHRGHHRPRPMTSGERQYRNGCLQGYITDDCEQFSATNLLRHGISPYL